MPIRHHAIADTATITKSAKEKLQNKALPTRCTEI
jgi:hypothetical protein